MQQYTLEALAKALLCYGIGVSIGHTIRIISYQHKLCKPKCQPWPQPKESNNILMKSNAIMGFGFKFQNKS